MGPATAGKSSLVRALRASDRGVRADLGVPRWRWFPRLVLRLTPLASAWLVRYRKDRWFTWNEMKSVAFLDSWLRAVRGGRWAFEGTTILDHGPVYRLARLREFGPSVTRSPRFQRWWRSTLEGWLQALDLIVALDAPDGVLLQRADTRGHWYLSGDLAAEEKRTFLARYRRAFSEVLGGQVGSPPTILRVRSDLQTPEEIADQVRAAIGRVTPRARGSSR